MSEHENHANVGMAERIISGLAGGALTLGGLRRGGLGGLLTAGFGGVLLLRGATGRSMIYERLGIDTTRSSWEHGVEFHRAMTVQRPVSEIMAMFSDPVRLGRVFERIESVDDLGGGRSRWRAREARSTLEWTAEITERTSDRICFATTEDSDLHLEGEVRLHEAPGDRGTEVRLSMRVSPPGGPAAMALAPMMRRLGRHQLGQEMARLKQLLESGEIATSEMLSAERRRQLEERRTGEYAEAERIEPSRREVSR